MPRTVTERPLDRCAIYTRQSVARETVSIAAIASADHVAGFDGSLVIKSPKALKSSSSRERRDGKTGVSAPPLV